MQLQHRQPALQAVQLSLATASKDQVNKGKKVAGKQKIEAREKLMHSMEDTQLKALIKMGDMSEASERAFTRFGEQSGALFICSPNLVKARSLASDMSPVLVRQGKNCIRVAMLSPYVTAATAIAAVVCCIA